MQLTAEQQKRITGLYHSYFKDSAIKIYDDNYFKQCLGDKTCNYMWLRFYLANNESEESHGYWSNDCFNIDFEIGTCHEGLYLKAKSKDYLIKPIFNKYNAYDRRVINHRMVKGDFEKVFNSLKKFFENLHKQVIEDIDNNIITANEHLEIAKLRVIR